MGAQGPSATPAGSGSVVQARIDLDALTRNAAVVAARIAPAQVMAVVKADSYGHRTDLIAPALYAAGIRDFAVATVPEAVALSDLIGPQARILCWLFDPGTDLTDCARRGIELGISTLAGLDAAISAGRQAGVSQRIHLKIDTGLGRNGLTDTQLDAVLDRLTELASEPAPESTAAGGAADPEPTAAGPVIVTGIMTHFANADAPGDPETAAQLRRFDPVLGRLEAQLPAALRAAQLRISLANSPAALSLQPVPGTHARTGISLYGLSPFEETSAASLGLTPVMTVTSKVLNVKDVPAGHGASYGMTYRTERDTRFALIAGGYADGLPRIAGNRGEVAIAKRRYPIVGRIAMDQMILDIGPKADDAAAPDVAIGDEAVIIGDGVSGPSAEEWAEWCETINYEIVTCIGARVDRIPVRSADGDHATPADGDQSQPSTHHPAPPAARRRRGGDL